MKPSRKKSLSRYNYGVVSQEHKGVVTTTAVGTPYFDSFNPVLTSPTGFKLGNIPIQFSHRPDLISHSFFKTPGYWWYIMMLNNLVDPFEDLATGDDLILPRP
tara:strand:- start:201 stop:509 length:309 start_codon:yes stop_codon:yes gene_type:complete